MFADADFAGLWGFEERMMPKLSIDVKCIKMESRKL
jgi:hypothetical protein